MEVTVKEDFVDKNTRWGVVKQSLNQHMVFVNGQHAGYVGTTAFLPLCGFPKELVDDVAAKCSELLGKPVASTLPPPSMEQLAAIIEGGVDADGED